jgi:TetR/AcrR family transcriptional regulator, repressor for uid operon
VAVTAEALDTRTRILDAAFRTVATFGLSRFTVDDVARAADLSRQTVYRYFESKDALIVALVYREEETFLEGVRRAHAEAPTLQEAMERAILFCLRMAREHPLLDRLLESEPEVLLPYLTTRAAGLIDRGRAVIEELAAGRDDVRLELIPRVADLAVRTIVSYTLTPGEDPPERVARETARVIAAAVQKRRKEEPR